MFSLFILKKIKTIFFPACELSDDQLKTKNITISKLEDDILNANEITLVLKYPPSVAETSIRDLQNFIKKSQINNIISELDEFSINFFNKDFKFQVKKIKSCQEIVEDDLVSALEQLSITKTKFYLITSNSNFKIIQNLNDDNGDSEIKLEEHVFGLDNVVEEVKKLIEFAYNGNKTIGNAKLTRGVLLHGPSGCGKSLLCRVLSKSSNCTVINVNASEIFSKYYGESENNLSEHFDRALNNHPNPTLIIVEEIKNICPKSSTDAVKRVTSLFCTLMDSLHTRKNGEKIFLIATVDNPDNLSPSVRRSGRLDCEIEIPVPNPETREVILKHLLKDEKLLNINDIKEVSKITHGFVGSDLESLVTKATINASQRGTLDVTLVDINNALIHIKPSAMREVLIESPNVKWTDIGGQHDLKLKLQQAVEWPIKHPEVFVRLGIRPPRGVLMFGPPGCSKTLIAKALATESGLNFLSIKGPELFSMWVGESERAVRDLFRKARQVAPSIIFFDEIDAIGSERSGDSGSSVKERVLAQILTEIDGVNALNNVVIVAATNRPDLIDKALLRPGRIDRIIYVTLPDMETRKEIFNIKTAKMSVASDVSCDDLAEMTDGYSGAEIQAVCNEAALKALEESLDAMEVRKGHFMYACKVIVPRTSSELLKLYEKYLKEF